MSLRDRIERLERKARGLNGRCESCGGIHVPDYAALILLAEKAPEDAPVCACPCCAWVQRLLESEDDAGSDGRRQ